MPWPAWFERPSPSPSSWWRAWKWLSSWTSVSGWEATPSSTWRFCSTGRGTHHDGVSDQSRCCQSELLWSSKICWISPDWSSGAGQTVSSHVPGRARYPASTGCWSSPWTSSWPPWAAGSCSRPSTRRTWSGRCSIAHSRSQYCPRRGVYVDPNMHEVSHFCLPHLLPVLKNTVRQLYEVFEYYETILATQLPYTCYKQAFVDQLFEEVFHYSTLPIYKTIILHSSAVIDQTYETRKLPALGLAAQFFGCYVSTEKWPDRWIKKGKPLYLMGLWVKKTFGNK